MHERPSSNRIHKMQSASLRPLLIVSLSMASLLVSGCSGQQRDEKQVFKVTGNITVDGKPLENVQVVFHDVAGPDTAKPTTTQGTTLADGKFVLSTYEEGDGAPKGEYKVTFMHQEYNLMARSYSGPDKFHKKYADPKTTPYSIKIGPGEKNDLGTVDLSTKK